MAHGADFSLLPPFTTSGVWFLTSGRALSFVGEPRTSDEVRLKQESLVDMFGIREYTTRCLGVSPGCSGSPARYEQSHGMLNGKSVSATTRRFELKL